jgi:hypothetical protein
MMTMTGRRYGAALCLALAGCASDFEQRERGVNLWGPADVATRSRTVAAEAWDTLWTFPSAAVAGRHHVRPRLLAATRGRIYLFDDSTRSVVALNDAGVPLWEIPGNQAAVGDLGSAIDIKIAPSGNLYVLDAQHARILVVTGTGELARQVALPKAPRALQIAPLDAERILVLPILGSALTVFDHAGKIVGDVSVPWPGFAELNPLARQGVTVSNERGTWVFAFGLGDGWFAFRGTRALGFTGKYVEYRPFPEVAVQRSGKARDMVLAEYAPCTGCAVSLSDSSMYVLAGGSSNSKREVVDEFALETGAYLRSFRLPEPMATLSVADGVYYGITTDETRHLVALRPKSAVARVTGSGDATRRSQTPRPRDVPGLTASMRSNAVH